MRVLRKAETVLQKRTKRLVVVIEKVRWKGKEGGREGWRRECNDLQKSEGIRRWFIYFTFPSNLSLAWIVSVVSCSSAESWREATAAYRPPLCH